MGQMRDINDRSPEVGVITEVDLLLLEWAVMQAETMTYQAQLALVDAGYAYLDWCGMVSATPYALQRLKALERIPSRACLS